MFNLLKKSTSVNSLLIILLIVAGLYFALAAPPVARAVDNDFLLTWSSNSYVPLDYEGKALPSRGSTIKVAVLPTKKLSQNPDALYYRWLLDNEIMYSAQGIGRSSFQFRATKWGGDDHEIESQILDSQEKIIWRGFLTIKIASPQILFKTTNSNYAAQDSLIAATGQNLTLLAEPLFFNTQNIADLAFSWAIDRQILDTLDEKNPNQLTIKIPAGNLSASIFKDLSLFIQNKADQLQQSTINLNIEIK